VDNNIIHLGTDASNMYSRIHVFVRSLCLYSWIDLLIILHLRSFVHVLIHSIVRPFFHLIQQSI